MKSFAIIGAGISGLVLARELQSVGHRVMVFEKARGVGGRMATRYADPYYCDHGAQYFTARLEDFKAWLEPYINQKIVQEWTGKVITLKKGSTPEKRMWFEPHYVATPNMNGICKKLSETLNISCNTEIVPLRERKDNGWVIYEKSGKEMGVFDWVISTAPAAQTASLFPDSLNGYSALQQVEFSGNYTVMLGFNTPWDKSWIAAKVHDSPIGWIAVNSSKPMRSSAATSLCIQSTAKWAENHIDEDVAAMQSLLLDELAALTDIDPTRADFVTTHRWRYANVATNAGNDYILDTELQLAACGDWCIAARIEAAWKSAMRLSEALHATLTDSANTPYQPMIL